MSETTGDPGDPVPAVSILIVNYRSTPLLRQCVAAIASQTAFGKTETIVVDNASPEFDAAGLQRDYPWLRIVASPTNLTYTGGNNLAFEYARGAAILLLNPDTVLEPAAIERAMGHLAERPDIAAQGATLLNEDGSLQRYYRRLPRWSDAPFVLLGPLFRRTRAGRRYLMLDEEFGPVTEVEQPPGAFLLARRSALGGRLLDPGYFNYMSDVELCARLRESGRILVFDDVRCQHRKGAAGVGTTDPIDQLRLRHDLTWGVRRFFRRSPLPARSYVEAWIYAFWFARLVQLVARHPGRTASGLRTAVRALRGAPPRYDGAPG